MNRRLLAALAILVLILMSTVCSIEAHKGGQKRKHVKAMARKFAKQIAKSQHDMVKKAHPVTSGMTYSAARGFCDDKIKALGDGECRAGCGALFAASLPGCLWAHL